MVTGVVTIVVEGAEKDGAVLVKTTVKLLFVQVSIVLQAFTTTV